jgi:hypothetical protein
MVLGVTAGAAQAKGPIARVKELYQYTKAMRAANKALDRWDLITAINETHKARSMAGNNRLLLKRADRLQHIVNLNMLNPAVDHRRGQGQAPPTLSSPTAGPTQPIPPTTHKDYGFTAQDYESDPTGALYGDGTM